ncbi:hypothetical protein [Mycolicibacterium mageritense]|uniref:hypothetical protein n=1 Tax=Mycolicibacterium mageritense TaxID=53462 RepID=UPI003F6837C5
MRRIGFAVAAAAAALALGACSSGESEPAPASPAPAEHGSFAHCLSEHGVPSAPGPVAGAPPGSTRRPGSRPCRHVRRWRPGPKTRHTADA